MNKRLVLLYGCDMEDLLADKKNWIRAWRGLLWVSEEDYGYLLYIDELLRRDAVSGLDMCHCVTALFWVPEGKQKVGRSRTTWRRTAEKEKVEAGWGYWEQ